MAKQYNIDEILTEEPYDALPTLCGELEQAGGLQIIGALNPTETHFLNAFNCWGGIECEGLSGWLRNNPDPDAFKEAVEAFRAIGASKRAEALSRILTLFPDSTLPEDPDEFAEVVTDSQHKQMYQEIEREMEEEDVETLLHRYITEHIQEFR